MNKKETFSCTVKKF